MFEVISSEVVYQKNLDVLVENFMDHPYMNPNLPEGRRVLDTRQHKIIFSNVKEVRETSRLFLGRLLERQRGSFVVQPFEDIVQEFVSIWVYGVMGSISTSLRNDYLLLMKIILDV